MQKPTGGERRGVPLDDPMLDYLEGRSPKPRPSGDYVGKPPSRMPGRYQYRISTVSGDDQNEYLFERGILRRVQFEGSHRYEGKRPSYSTTFTVRGPLGDARLSVPWHSRDLVSGDEALTFGVRPRGSSARFRIVRVATDTRAMYFGLFYFARWWEFSPFFISLGWLYLSRSPSVDNIELIFWSGIGATALWSLCGMSRRRRKAIALCQKWLDGQS